MSADLLGLAERVEGLAGPDREVDEDIVLAIVPEFSRRSDGQLVNRFNSPVHIVGVSTHWCFSSSLDVAMSLVPEGWHPALKHVPGRGRWEWKASLWAVRQDRVDATAATPALALTAAALRARAAIGEGV